jgi:hypothetical protein
MSWITKQCATAEDAAEPLNTTHSWPTDGTHVLVVEEAITHRPGGEWEVTIPAGTTGITDGYVEEWHDVVVLLDFDGSPVWIDVDNLREA